MEKLVYLLHKSPDVALDAAFTRTLHEAMVPALRARGASGIVLNVADLNEPVREAAPSRLVGEWDALAAAVHFWIDNVDTRFGIEEALAPYATRLSGYLVCESVVQKTPRTWRDGERRPGHLQQPQRQAARTPHNSADLVCCASLALEVDDTEYAGY